MTNIINNNFMGHPCSFTLENLGNQVFQINHELRVDGIQTKRYTKKNISITNLIELVIIKYLISFLRDKTAWFIHPLIFYNIKR